MGAAVRYFRGTLDVPEGRAIKSARGLMTCDNFAVLHVNGKQACKTDDELNAGWRSPVQVDLKPHLAAGRNVLAVRAENFDSQTANPAGLIGVFKVEFDQGPPLVARHRCGVEVLRDGAARLGRAGASTTRPGRPSRSSPSTAAGRGVISWAPAAGSD